MHVFYTPDIAVTCEMPEEEAAHCLRVLRLGVGDEVMLTDGKGCFYKAVISAATGKRCQVKVTETIEQEPLWNGHCIWQWHLLKIWTVSSGWPRRLRRLVSTN